MSKPRTTPRAPRAAVRTERNTPRSGNGDPTSEVDSAFGAKISAVRTAKGISQRELARRSGMSHTTLWLIEKGDVSPSLSSVVRLLDALGVSMSEFFADKPATEDQLFFKSRELIKLVRSKSVQLLQVGPSRQDRAMQMLIGHYKPGADTGAEMLVHEGEEVGVIVAGRFEITVGSQVSILEPGDGYYFDSRTPHRFRNISRVTGQIISTNTPPSL